MARSLQNKVSKLETKCNEYEKRLLELVKDAEDARNQHTKAETTLNDLKKEIHGLKSERYFADNIPNVRIYFLRTQTFNSQYNNLLGT